MRTSCWPRSGGSRTRRRPRTSWSCRPSRCRRATARVWTQEGAQEAAQARLDATLAILHGEGLDATGSIGDWSPINAIRDALIDFDADLIVISTHPEARSRWLRKGVVEKAREFGPPVIHIVSNVPAGAGA